ncbi:diguanylate cyclase domain-containing protein, partial [Streptomyces cadmiisoli]|uniref:diguanylate cyclase domain-containing protein n=1 Tax=Streptomyces cadmiisoli TaxID=2184053 RepID=UPI003D7072E5
MAIPRALAIADDVRVRRALRTACWDPLTGLADRTALTARTDRLARTRREDLHVLVADADGLKTANDTLGHTARRAGGLCGGFESLWPRSAALCWRARTAAFSLGAWWNTRPLCMLWSGTGRTGVGGSSVTRPGTQWCDARAGSMSAGCRSPWLRRSRMITGGRLRKPAAEEKFTVAEERAGSPADRFWSSWQGSRMCMVRGAELRRVLR